MASADAKAQYIIRNIKEIDNKIVRISLSGGIIGILLTNPKEAIQRAVQIENERGWRLVQILPHKSQNLFIAMAQVIVVIFTLLLWTWSDGYLLIFERDKNIQDEKSGFNDRSIQEDYSGDSTMNNSDELVNEAILEEDKRIDIVYRMISPVSVSITGIIGCILSYSILSMLIDILRQAYSLGLITQHRYDQLVEKGLFLVFSNMIYPSLIAIIIIFYTIYIGKKLKCRPYIVLRRYKID